MHSAATSAPSRSPRAGKPSRTRRAHDKTRPSASRQSPRICGFAGMAGPSPGRALLAILDVTIPFFGLVLCGFLAARARKLPQQTVAALNGFVLYFSLPAMLFRFAAGAPFTDVVNPGVFLSYALTGLAVLFGVSHGLRRRRGDRDRKSVVEGRGGEARGRG